MNIGASGSSFDWLADNCYRVVSIVGISKNAGKTTVLNHLVKACQKSKLGVFSTGIDGEETDKVFQTPKPKVNLVASQFFCCDTATADSLGSSITLLESVTAQRTLWLAEATQSIQTEITGPASVSDQINVAKRMLDLGAVKVFIDGSLDRKSIALSSSVDAVIMLIGASFGSVSAIIDELKRLQLLNALTQAYSVQEKSTVFKILRERGTVSLYKNGLWIHTKLESLIGNEKKLAEFLQQEPEYLYIPGVITDDIYTKIKSALQVYSGRIILRHPDCLKLSLNKLEQFLAYADTEVLIPFNIMSYVLNSEAVGSGSADADEYRSKLRRAFPGLKLLDIRELV